jgi:O-antigen ligase/Tfp pilus assembly protein PilF
MLALIANIIPAFYYFLFFSVPLVLYPYTSELFEFNKMIVVYIMTTFIVGSWIVKSIIQKKIIIRRTILNIPLLLFLLTQLLSTVTSIDFRTSLLGYYSRYHGGLISSISYSLLYWAYVSNMDKQRSLKAIHYLLASSLLVCIYAILEHYGIDKNIWVQDVQNRVFSTLGQPNWLAAFIVAIIPLTWTLAISEKDSSIKNKARVIYLLLSVITFLTLLYTKSRSGVLGFAISAIIFWPLVLWVKRKVFPSVAKPVIFIFLTIITMVILEGTPWNRGIFTYLAQKDAPLPEQQKQTIEPRELDVQISPSGDIRKIVWKGAVDIWKAYPVLGSGVETFAYSYYNFRPASHNLLSEWDFLYNKAHNEYLNFLATSGTIGFLSYAILTIFIIIQILNIKFSVFKNVTSDKTYQLESDNPHILLQLSLFVGFISILVTNFFGFSVVPVGLEFFLFPAIAVTLRNVTQSKQPKSISDLNSTQKLFSSIVFGSIFYIVYLTGKYWLADLNYSKGLALNSAGNVVDAGTYLSKAVSLSPNEAVFWSDLSEVSTTIAIELAKQDKQELLSHYVASAITQMSKADSLSPKNVNIKRKNAGNYIKLSILSPTFLNNAKTALESAIILAPTDAKLYYNYGLVYAKEGDIDKAMEIFDKTIDLKSNYRNARLAKAILLAEQGKEEEAKYELEYILQRIDPNDKIARQQLEELKN